MEKESEGNVFNQIANFFTRYPKVTVTLITLFAFGTIGGIIYLAPRFGHGQSTNITANSLKFDLPSGSPQNQGDVQGANTQADEPEEQPSSLPSQNPISETP